MISGDLDLGTHSRVGHLYLPPTVVQESIFHNTGIDTEKDIFRGKQNGTFSSMKDSC